MVTPDAIADAVGDVLDPHLPFGLRELGMLECVEVADDGAVKVVVTMPCHHCPGLQQLRDDIVAIARGAGVCGEVRVSFHGRERWEPVRVSAHARAALRTFGVQIAPAQVQKGRDL